MKCLHIMLSRGLGGIEQVFLDHTAMLREQGWQVVPVTHPKAAVNASLDATLALPNWGAWDRFASWRLKRLIAQEKPDILLTHGSRALTLARRAAGVTPLVAMAHNYWLKPFCGLQHAFAITPDVAKALAQEGVREVTVIPNIVQPVADIAPARRTPQKPPVIGAMGRFVEKKGFADLLTALAELKLFGQPFRAVIAGDGEEAKNLQAQCTELGLEDFVRFPGWAKDKRAFFDSIDVFCLPSRHEPFGIVLLEAMAHGVPVVTTPSEGPSQIATPETNALFAHSSELASALRRLLNEPALAEKIRQGGLETAARHAPSIVGPQLSSALNKLCTH